MRTPWVMGALALLQVLAGGCGDPLISSSAYDSPLFTVRGSVSPLPTALDHPRVAVVWVDPEGVRDDLPGPSDTTASALSDGAFTLSFYAPPPAQVIRRLPDTDGRVATSFAFGELVVYEDRDDDGTFQITPIEEGSSIVAPDVYRGTSFGAYVLVYVDQPLPADSEVLTELQGVLAGARGYTLGWVTCGNPDAPLTRRVDPTMPVGMVLLEEPTADLPPNRPCLRSHAAPATPTPR